MLFPALGLATDIVGTYTSVTESDCNLTIELARNGKAMVEQQCVAEDGSHKRFVEKYPMNWRIDGNHVFLKGKEHSGRLKRESYISYKPIGLERGSAGLKVIEGPLFQGYGDFWLTPILSNDR